MYKSENYVIYPLNSKDLKSPDIKTIYYTAINDIRYNQYTDRCRYPLTEKQCDEYIDSHFVFGIFNKELVHVGNIGIDNIDHMNRSCEIGLFIWEQNRGVGSGCLPIVVDHCFNRLNMQRVWMGTLAGNIAMNSLAVKCGFHLEGSQKRARIINNKYEDVMTYVKFCD